MVADSMTAARRTPVIAAFLKMIFPFLVILPGMIAGVVTSSKMHDSATRESVAGTATQPSFFTGGEGGISRQNQTAGSPAKEDGKKGGCYVLWSAQMDVGCCLSVW